MIVESFGCRLNLAEGDAVAGFAGDVTVVNTCAVTAEAVRQGRQAVRRAAAGGARIVATGCAATLDPAGFGGLPGVVRVVANDEKLDPASYALPLPSREREGPAPSSAWEGEGTSPRGDVPSPSHSPEEGERVPPSPSRGEGKNHTRGFVAVQTGCDHACTFCIIPFARGPARSFAPERIVAEIAALTDAGCNEVVLTGVDLTSFGPTPLGRLVQRILRDVPALPRLRLSSLDSVEIDDALVEALGEPRLMPHLHLSLQSGDDLILKRMRRRHSRAQAVAVSEQVRRVRPGIALSADFIAGFPTESDAAFAGTLALVDDAGLTGLHVFPYSPRPGTAAARMPQVAPIVARARAARLRAVGAERRAAALAALVGRRQRVLVEADGGSGHTETFFPARLAAPAPRGTIADVVVTAATATHLECA